MVVEKRHTVYVVIPSTGNDRDISVHDRLPSARREVERWNKQAFFCEVLRRAVKPS